MSQIIKTAFAKALAEAKSDPEKVADIIETLLSSVAQPGKICSARPYSHQSGSRQARNRRPLRAPRYPRPPRQCSRSQHQG